MKKAASKTTKNAKATKKAAAPKKRTPKAVEATTTAAKPETAVPETTPKSEARDGSKKATVLALLRREQGATMAEIAEATSWQKHSIRGFISGALTKKMGLTVESAKNEAGERTYRIPAAH